MVSWFTAIGYCKRRSIQKGLTPCYSYGSYDTNLDEWPSGWNTANENHTNVSCNWDADGYRLPTEMAWMYAAKGGNGSQGYSGSEDINAVACIKATMIPMVRSKLAPSYQMSQELMT